ncbi:MAG: hypothetical protein ACJ78Q_01020 [Chloroflexia bacterium]
MKTPMIFVSAILFAFLIAAGAFWGGMSVGRAGAQSDRSPVITGPGLNPGNLPPNAPFPSSLGGVQPGPSAGGPFPNAPGGFADASAVTGTILQVSQDTLTLANDQGQMISVSIPNDTLVVKNVLGDRSDFRPGAHVVVRGARSGDDISARQVQFTDLPGPPQRLPTPGR